ncbi:MAG: decarboxylase, partial [Lachnospiraceae bacterium]|nr:decarboxylase [Lachnospiraceae bacterium]
HSASSAADAESSVAPIAAMTMEEADCCPHEPVLLEACAGRTAAEFVYLYPPGIPLLVPGEQIPDGFSERIRRYRKMGLHLQGLADYRTETIQCVVSG